MRHIYLGELQEETAFVQKAAAKFASDPIYTTYSEQQSPGGNDLFAVRWGVGNDCILVFKLADEEPRVYAQIIKPDGG